MKGITVRGIVFSALFAALLIVLSPLKISIGLPVPISLQNFAIMLAGGLLGAYYGFFSVFLVVLLTALGLPLLGETGGLAKILGPTGGFIWMFSFSALFIGYFVSKIKDNGIIGFILIFLTLEVFGSLLLYVTGVPWLAHFANLDFQKAMALGCYPFLPGDAIKAVVGALIIVSIRRVYPLERMIGR